MYCVGPSKGVEGAELGVFPSSLHLLKQVSTEVLTAYSSCVG